jgi:diguanylate cyclase (GGDEF)-like protein
MAPPHAYRNRLIIYVVLLELFLICVLYYFYGQSRDAILDAASRNLGLFSSQLDAKIKLEEHELEQSARLISDNMQLREYMFVVVSIGTETDPLHELFERQFGWLKYRSAVIISRNGDVLIGDDKQLLSEISKKQFAENAEGEIFYYTTEESIEMATAMPVYYQNEFLGYVVLTNTMDASLIETARSSGYGQFFVVSNGKILRSSLQDDVAGWKFKQRNGLLRLLESDFLVSKISYFEEKNLPQVWFGFSNPKLTGQLDRNRSQMLTLVIGVSVIILVIGIAMIRNFSHPVGRLVSIMNDVGDGQFPKIESSQSRDEFGYLINKFQDMVTRLREKQNEVDRVHAQLEKQATTDSLTGLYNRRYLYDLFPKLLSDATRQGKTITFILADLDKFKIINDKYGHVIGDQVLTHVSGIMRDCCRASDFVFRVGGEEFLVLITGDLEDGKTVAEKIRSKIEQSPLKSGDLLLLLSSSFGVAQLEPMDGDARLSDTLARADKALYTAKQYGRNRVRTLDISENENETRRNQWQMPQLKDEQAEQDPATIRNKPRYFSLPL